MFLLNHKLHNNSIHALGEDGAVRIVFSFTKEKSGGHQTALFHALLIHLFPAYRRYIYYTTLSGGRKGGRSVSEC